MTYDYYCKRLTTALSKKEIGRIVSKIQQLKIKSEKWINVTNLSSIRKSQIDKKQHWNQPNLYEKTSIVNGTEVKFHEQYTVTMCTNCGQNLWIMRRVFDHNEDHDGILGKRIFAMCESGCSSEQYTKHIPHICPSKDHFKKLAYENNFFEYTNQ